RRIIEGIDWRLGARGLQRVDGTGNPDLVVVYYAAADSELRVNTDTLRGWGAGWTWGTRGAPLGPVQNVRAGELAVGIAIVQVKRFIWRGMASDTISENPGPVQKKLNKSLDKMFQKFPIRSQNQARRSVERLACPAVQLDLDTCLARLTAGWDQDVGIARASSNQLGKP